MPGPEDKTADVWKDHDVNPTRCGSCGSDNIGKQGDFFRCNACGHDWAVRVDPASIPLTLEQRIDKLEAIIRLHDEIIELIFIRALDGPITQFDDEEMKVIMKYNEYRRSGTLA